MRHIRTFVTTPSGTHIDISLTCASDNQFDKSKKGALAILTANVPELLIIYPGFSLMIPTGVILHCSPQTSDLEFYLFPPEEGIPGIHVIALPVLFDTEISVRILNQSGREFYIFPGAILCQLICLNNVSTSPLTL